MSIFARCIAAYYCFLSFVRHGRAAVCKEQFFSVCITFILQFSYSPRHGGAICHAVMSCFTCFPHEPRLIARSVEVDCAFPRFCPINRLSICNEHFRQMYCRILLFFVVRSPRARSCLQRIFSLACAAFTISQRCVLLSEFRVFCPFGRAKTTANNFYHIHCLVSLFSPSLRRSRQT